jgi:hypothetical protein
MCNNLGYRQRILEPLTKHPQSRREDVLEVSGRLGQAYFRWIDTIFVYIKVRIQATYLQP